MATKSTKPQFRIPNIDEQGFGVDGSMTRRQWQQECLSIFLSGPETFNAWQQKLVSLPAPTNRGQFNWEMRTSEDSDFVRYGWSGNSPFVVDIAHRAFTEDMMFLNGYEIRTGLLLTDATFGNFLAIERLRGYEETYFLGVKFQQGAIFSNCHFSQGALFDHSIFEEHASFSDCEFLQGALLRDVLFRDRVSFDGSNADYLSFDGSTFSKDAIFTGRRSKERSQQDFGETSFSGTRFQGRADFSNREFKSLAAFGIRRGQQTIFEKAPLFHNSKLHQGTTFADAIFLAPSEIDHLAARAYTTLRHAMSQQQATREEQRFLKLELDAERFSEPRAKKFFYSAYKTLADYGFSIWRPAIYLLLVPCLVGAAIYGALAAKPNCSWLWTLHCQLDFAQTAKIFGFAILQSLPPLGVERMNLALVKEIFGNEMPLRLLTFVTLQTFASLLGWFFIALALRNLFKMK